jgi:hypothetical protein
MQLIVSFTSATNLPFTNYFEFYHQLMLKKVNSIKNDVENSLSYLVPWMVENSKVESSSHDQISEALMSRGRPLSLRVFFNFSRQISTLLNNSLLSTMPHTKRVPNSDDE